MATQFSDLGGSNSDIGVGSTGQENSPNQGGSGGAGVTTDADANIPGAAPRGGAEYGTDRPNVGSARRDYGTLAYGGRLDERGQESGGTRDDDSGRRDVGSRGYRSLRRQSQSTGGGGNDILMLFTGIGIGALLMYILDPDQGRRRRALLRDKVVSASNKAGDVIDKRSRDLANRAQGVIAEASSMLGRGGQTNEQQSGVQGAGAAGTTVG